MTKKMRLDRLLSNLGYGGRQDVTYAIKNGLVTIDAKPITDPSLTIDLDLARGGYVLLNGEPIDAPSPFTIMLNKPVGYTCSREDSGPVIYDLLPNRWLLRKPALSSVGRLDKESSGQLLITDDGDLLHKIISPKTITPKYYTVTLRDDVRGDESELFKSGAFMLRNEPKPLKPAQWIVEGTRSGVMILSEGRYHQIRRMFASIGNEVITLHRIQTGGLSLSDLVSGEYRILNANDIKSIF